MSKYDVECFKPCLHNHIDWGEIGGCKFNTEIISRLELMKLNYVVK